MNKQEQWIKWEPTEGINKVYAIGDIVDDLEGLTILLEDFYEEGKKIRVFFEDSVNAYRCTDEGYRLNISDFFIQPTGEDLYGRWGFFKVKNSSYLQWLEKESSGFFNAATFTHYAFVGENRIVDVATIGDPKVEFI